MTKKEMAKYHFPKEAIKPNGCNAWALILVDEGVQCSNCGALQVDGKINHASNK